ncbi:hypothetical protein PM082_004415 [Marasmius tenuissimus]|nr:hypothetical protein PM082_004415 [Marasmius tenuissimus]
MPRGSQAPLLSLCFEEDLGPLGRLLAITVPFEIGDTLSRALKRRLQRLQRQWSVMNGGVSLIDHIETRE